MRPALDSDIPAIARIQAEAMHALLLAAGANADEVAVDYAPALERSWATTLAAPSPRSYYLVAAHKDSSDTAFAEEKICGVGVMQLVEGTDGDSVNAHIEAIHVPVEAQHRGHGSRLLSAMYDHARAAGASLMTVWISPDDEAHIRFFSGAGFGPSDATSETQIGRSGTLTEHLWFALVEDTDTPSAPTPDPVKE